jgi:tetratricopeptide (TPR) repeat protein
LGSLCAAEFSNWDDPENIARNPRLNPPSWESVRYYWTHEHMLLYMPVTLTAWSGAAAVAQLDAPDPDGIALNPWVFHTLNVLLHVVCTLLAFAVLLTLFGDQTAALIGALAFALHPVQVETVGWVSGTKDLLCGAFAFLAIWLYLHYARDPRARRARIYYALGLVAMVLAILSKPTAMVVPLIVAVLDYFLVRRRATAVLRSLAPWALVAASLAVVAAMVQPASGIESVPLAQRPFLAGFTLAFYLAKLIAPLHLAFDYGWRPPLLSGHWWFHVAWIVPAALAVVAWIYRRRAPALAAAAIVFVAGVAPVLGLSRFEFQVFSTVADHYLYLSMLGVAIVAAWAVASARRSRPALIIAAIVLAAWGVRSFVQARVWRDDFALESHILSVNPDSFAAYAQLATSWGYRANRHRAAGETDQARDAYRTAADLLHRSLTVAPYPRWYRETGAHLVRVTAALLDVEPSPQAQRARLQETVDLLEHLTHQRPGGHDLTPGDLQALREGIANLYVLAGDWPRAVEHYERALQFDPTNARVRQSLDRARQRLR